MKGKASRLAVVPIVLALCAGGCATNGLVIDFNGRTVEVRRMRELSLPRGLEVTRFDGRVMEVNGREPITLNGKELTVDGSDVRLGSSRHVLGPQHRLVIERTGKLSIVEQKESGEKASWWGFWR